MYDLIIVGAGPGGVSAGVYAARKKIKTLLITDSFGGQSAISGGIENWIGTKSLTGYDLAKALEEHIRAQSGIEIIDDDLVTGVETMAGAAGAAGGYRVLTRNGKTHETKYVLIASGSSRKRLNVPGEKEHEGRGVVYCSTCDAPLFDNKTVVVVGGGNSALESVLDLHPYAKKIYLMIRSEVLKGDPVSQDKVRNNPKVEIIWNGVVDEVLGSAQVTGVRYHDVKTNESKELAVEGVFVEVGLIPNSDFVKGVVDLDDRGDIKVDARTQRTSAPGIWAIGDVTDGIYRQNNISAGDAVKAVLNIYDEVKMA